MSNTNDWQTFERHLRDALASSVEQATGKLRSDGDLGSVTSNHTLDSLVQELRSIGMDPYSTIRHLEARTNEDSAERAEAYRKYDELDEQIQELENRLENPADFQLNSGRAIPARRLRSLLASMGLRFDEHRNKVGNLDLLGNVVEKYRQHITNTYGLGSPAFNRYYF